MRKKSNQPGCRRQGARAAGPFSHNGRPSSPVTVRGNGNGDVKRWVGAEDTQKRHVVVKSRREEEVHR